MAWGVDVVVKSGSQREKHRTSLGSQRACGIASWESNSLSRQTEGEKLLAATLFFGILTLWLPGYWAVAVFEVSMFGLAVDAILRWRRTSPPFAYPLVPLLFAVFWGLLQLWTGRTVSL
jgi:hypothetical protein